MKWGGFKKSKPIPTPPPLQGGENPRGAKRGRGEAKLPSLFEMIRICEAQGNEKIEIEAFYIFKYDF